MDQSIRMEDRDHSRERDRRRDNRFREQRENRRSPMHSDEERDYDHSRTHRRDNRRSHRSRSRERERERDYPPYRRDRDRYDANGSEEYYGEHSERGRERREEPPNNTIMLKGLGLQIGDHEIATRLAEVGLRARDIRLMRKKTGEPRGFAFVEFNTVDEAIQWKNFTQGYIVFSDGLQASLHFSIQKDAYKNDGSSQLKSDWTCYKCGVVNFKRRDVCFKCGTTREESLANETGDEISSTPTNCLLLRNLAPNTSEGRVLSSFVTITQLPIKSIKIFSETGIAKCLCYVELYTTNEAVQLYNLLCSLAQGFSVDGNIVSVCYAKRNQPQCPRIITSGLRQAATTALAAAQWTNQSEAGNLVSSLPMTSRTESSSITVTIPMNAPVLTSGIDYGVAEMNGVTYRKYPIPDVSTYQYEETSGFYYDAITCLYYDSKTHYYYNGTNQKYVFWSQEHQTYLPIELISTQTAPKAVNPTPKPTNEISAVKEESNETPEDKEKNDKVKIAKKIAKDMEKWAKTLNQKKDINRPPAAVVAAPVEKTAGISEGFTLREKRLRPSLEMNALFDPYDEPIALEREERRKEVEIRKNSPPPYAASEQAPTQKLNLTDWNKLLCLLCKRQFSSREQLSKHQQASELHKTNLFKLTGVKMSQEQIEEISQNDGEFNFTYRDRAKERREKYGQPDVPESKYKDKLGRGLNRSDRDRAPRNAPEPVQAYNMPATPSSGLENSIGAKMLKQMGWNDGQGLGKANQGRSSIIEVERRAAGAGLGVKSSAPHPSGESYKDAVKRTMMERYRTLHEKELAEKLNQS